MIKILKITKCNACTFLKRFSLWDNDPKSPIFLYCSLTPQLKMIESNEDIIKIPNWCPLETFEENNQNNL